MDKAKRVAFAAGGRTMELHVGSLAETWTRFKKTRPRGKTLFLVDETVLGLHGDRLAGSLDGFDPEKAIRLPSGERHKTLQTLEWVYGRLCALGAERGDLLVVVGGGVAGDLGGFAAATYKRGMAFVNVPTTLLAQVDSCAGGKTAVNLPAGKNMVGAFHHPEAILSDPAFLETLPPRILKDGMAELVKYGCIEDRSFLAELAETAERKVFMRNASRFVERAVEIKMRYVAEDEKDTGKRMLLNFGHTLAHAYEAFGGYGSVSHGEAVARGMYQITRLSESKGLTEPRSAKALKSALQLFGFDPEPFGTLENRQALVDFMRQDKKASGGVLTLVLLERIGKAYRHPVAIEALEAFFEIGEKVAY